MHAEIAGGGIGALATAAALAQRGWSVRVHERQPALRTLGAGIFLFENGLRVLEALGAFLAATRDTRPLSGWETQVNGRVAHRVDFPDAVRVFAIPRQQLLVSLADAAISAGAEIVTGSHVAGATPEGELLLADGRRLTADLVIGVDGIGSAVRDSLGLTIADIKLNDGAIRLNVSVARQDYDSVQGRVFVEAWNGARRLGVIPIGPKEIYLAFACPADDERGRRLPLDKGLWREAFPAHARYIDLVGQQGHWDVFSVNSVRSWSKGYAAILGDAAHALPPNLGQGGGLAMQNGLALAVALESVRDRREVPKALSDWERRERPIVEHCQKWSLIYGEMVGLPDDLKASALRFVRENSWISGQLNRTAMHLPTGA